MPYSKEQLDKIWEKASFSGDKNEQNGFRKDMCGAWIKKDKYGEEGNYGWDVDHIYPESKARKDGISEKLYNDLKNLQPLHHKNNGPEGKGDDYPSFNSKINSSSTNNVEKRQKFTIPISKQNELEELFK